MSEEKLMRKWLQEFEVGYQNTERKMPKLKQK